MTQVTKKRRGLFVELAHYQFVLALFNTLIIVAAVALTSFGEVILAAVSICYSWFIASAIKGPRFNPMAVRSYFFTFSDEIFQPRLRKRGSPSQELGPHVVAAMFCIAIGSFMAWRVKLATAEQIVICDCVLMTVLAFLLLHLRFKDDEQALEEAEKPEDPETPETRSTVSPLTSNDFTPVPESFKLHVEEACERLHVTFPPAIQWFAVKNAARSLGVGYEALHNVLWIDNRSIQDLTALAEDERWIAGMGGACAKYFPWLRRAQKIQYAHLCLSVAIGGIAQAFGVRLQSPLEHWLGIVVALTAWVLVFVAMHYISCTSLRVFDLLVNVEAALFVNSVQPGIRLHERWDQVAVPRGSYQGSMLRQARLPSGQFATFLHPVKVSAVLQQLKSKP